MARNLLNSKLLFNLFLVFGVLLALGCSKGALKVTSGAANDFSGNLGGSQIQDSVVENSCFSLGVATMDKVSPSTASVKVNEEVTFSVTLPTSCVGTFALTLPGGETKRFVAPTTFFKSKFLVAGTSRQLATVSYISRVLNGSTTYDLEKQVDVVAATSGAAGTGSSIASPTLRLVPTTANMLVNSSGVPLQAAQFFLSVSSPTNVKITSISSSPIPAALQVIEGLVPSSSAMSHTFTVSLAAAGDHLLRVNLVDATNANLTYSLSEIVTVIPVQVLPPPEVTLTADGMSGNVPKTSMDTRIRWSVAYAERCVTSHPFISGLGGEKLERIPVTTTYTLSCSNASATTSKTLTVTVNCAANRISEKMRAVIKATDVPVPYCPAGVVFSSAYNRLAPIKDINSRCTYWPLQGGGNQERPGAYGKIPAPLMTGLVPGAKIYAANLEGTLIQRIYHGNVQAAYSCATRPDVASVQFVSATGVRIEIAGYPNGIVPLSQLKNGFEVPAGAAYLFGSFQDSGYFDNYPNRQPKAGYNPPGGYECKVDLAQVGCQ